MNRGAQDLWDDKRHVAKMMDLCIEHCKDICGRYRSGEIDTSRFFDLMPSASHQLKLFTDRFVLMKKL